jgi:regulator of sirC expression with transglutaminase-like and TPR domain
MAQFTTEPEFSKLVAGRSDVDLVQLMLELAAEAYPNLDRLGCLLEIDRLGVACSDDACCREQSVRERLTAISRQLYEVEGFHGNVQGYYEPQNSYLNEVLARRCGIPISLGILYMAVAARAGLKMHGVNTPGHFVISCPSVDGPVFVDPFSGGDVLDLCECRARIEASVGKQGVLCDAHFRPACPRDIVARVLRNLKVAYSMQNRWPAALGIQERLAALLPQIREERRDLGLLYLRLGRPNKALPLLETYLCGCACEERTALQPSIHAARKMSAEMN